MDSSALRNKLCVALGLVSWAIGSTPPALAVGSVATITVSPANVYVGAGSSVQFSAVAKDAAGLVVPGVTFTWSTSSAYYCQINTAGYATFPEVFEEGCTIFAMASGKAGTTQVYISATASVSTIDIIAPATTIATGTGLQLSAKAYNGTGQLLGGQTFTWQVTVAASACSVSSSGLVTVPSTSTATSCTVFVSSGGVSKSIALSVTSPNAISTISMTPAQASIVIGKTTQLTAQAMNSSGTVITGTTFTWTSSNPSLCAVSSTGLVSIPATASPGSCTINASAGGKTSAASMSVTLPPTVATVTVSPATLAITGGNSKQLTAVAKSSTGTVITGVAFAWSTSNSTLCPINATTGLLSVPITAPPGVCTITATASGKSGTSAVSVSETKVVNSVIVSPATITIAGGTSAPLVATARNINGTNLTGVAFAWSTNQAALCPVTATTGLVSVPATATPGSCTITATASGKSGTAALTVTAAPKITSVILSPSPAWLAPGSVSQFGVSVYNSLNTAVYGLSTVWSSSNPSLCAISSTGVVSVSSGVTSGGCTITATVSGVAGTSAVSIINPPIVATIGVTPATVTVVPGATSQLIATARNSSGGEIPGLGFVWTSSNPTRCAVHPSTGLVSVPNNAGAGSCTITASAGGRTGSSSVTVGGTALTVASVSVTPNSAAMLGGQTQQLVAVAKNSSGAPVTVPSFTWTTNNTSFCPVNSTGLVSIPAVVTSGTCNITVQTSGKSAVASIAVSAAPPAVASVTVSPVTSNVNVGASQQLTATAKDAGGKVITGVGFTWSTSNPLLCPVSASGLVPIPINSLGGQCTITASAAGKSATATLSSIATLYSTMSETDERDLYTADSDRKISVTSTRVRMSDLDEQLVRSISDAERHGILYKLVSNLRENSVTLLLEPIHRTALGQKTHALNRVAYVYHVKWGVQMGLTPPAQGDSNAPPAFFDSDTNYLDTGVEAIRIGSPYEATLIHERTHAFNYNTREQWQVAYFVSDTELPGSSPDMADYSHLAAFDELRAYSASVVAEDGAATRRYLDGDTDTWEASTRLDHLDKMTQQMDATANECLRRIETLRAQGWTPAVKKVLEMAFVEIPDPSDVNNPEKSIHYGLRDRPTDPALTDVQSVKDGLSKQLVEVADRKDYVRAIRDFEDRYYNEPDLFEKKRILIERDEFAKTMKEEYTKNTKDVPAGDWSAENDRKNQTITEKVTQRHDKWTSGLVDDGPSVGTPRKLTVDFGPASKVPGWTPPLTRTDWFRAMGVDPRHIPAGVPGLFNSPESARGFVDHFKTPESRGTMAVFVAADLAIAIFRGDFHSMSDVAKAALTAGALGVTFAAFEHFLNKGLVKAISLSPVVASFVSAQAMNVIGGFLMATTDPMFRDDLGKFFKNSDLDAGTRALSYLSFTTVLGMSNNPILTAILFEVVKAKPGIDLLTARFVLTQDPDNAEALEVIRTFEQRLQDNLTEAERFEDQMKSGKFSLLAAERALEDRWRVLTANGGYSNPFNQGEIAVIQEKLSILNQLILEAEQKTIELIYAAADQGAYITPGVSLFKIDGVFSIQNQGGVPLPLVKITAAFPGLREQRKGLLALKAAGGHGTPMHILQAMQDAVEAQLIATLPQNIDVQQWITTSSTLMTPEAQLALLQSRGPITVKLDALDDIVARANEIERRLTLSNTGRANEILGYLGIDPNTELGKWLDGALLVRKVGANGVVGVEFKERPSERKTYPPVYFLEAGQITNRGGSYSINGFDNSTCYTGASGKCYPDRRAAYLYNDERDPYNGRTTGGEEEQ